MNTNLLRAGTPSLAPRTGALGPALGCALLASTCLTGPAAAQTAQPSVYQHVDANGVDLTDGSFNFSLVEGSIGTGEGALAVVRTYGRGGNSDGLPGRLHRSLYSGNEQIWLTFDNRTEHFDLAGGVWVPRKGDGATIGGSADAYTYRSADGTIVTYGAPGRSGLLTVPGDNGIQYCIDDSADPCELLPLSASRPNGRRIDLYWNVAEICGEPDIVTGQPCDWFPRLAGFVNESAYQAEFRYAEDNYGSTGPSTDWFRRTGARLFNNAVEPCDPEAIDCTSTISYAQPSSGVTEVTDPAGRVWRFSGTGTSFAIRRPGSASDDVVVSRDATTGVVSAVAADGVTTNYARSVSGATATMVVTNALNQQSTVVSDLDVGRPTSVTDPLGRTTSFSYDSFGRLTRTTAPLGNYVEHSYDARGNVTQTSRVARPGSGEANIVTSAAFASTCTNGVTCNLPTSTTNARGNATDYTYDSTHGGLLTVTLPAAPNGVRPQARLAYSQVTGAAGVPVTVLTQTSACQTQASCAGSADEVRTTIGYDANLQPATVTSGAGDGSLSATTTSAYDRFGNLASVDGPLAGAEDTVRYRYDAARQLVGTISPDPDGAEPLPHRAERTTYRPDGQASRIETGNVAGVTDTDWAAMTVAEQVDIGFDANDRPSSQTLSAGGATHAVSHTSYDALGRAECTALRMDSSDWGSGAANACSQDPSPSSHGPDRIGRTVFDAAGQVTQQRTAVGTSLEAPEVTSTYTANGQVETLTDAESNRTTYAYDGHGRLRQTRFPVPTQGANQSSTSDYEELGYDAAGNVTSRRNRAGETTLFSFDALGRMTARNRPGSEDDASYAHDLMGRLVSATDFQKTLSLGYDALGRTVAQTSRFGTVGSTFDLAGRRTRITHPDGFFVDQDYLVTGEMTRIRENGATSGVGVLATFGYDDRGRRTSLTRGNGTVTTYAYDPASRLSQLVEDVSGTTHDLTLGFGYNPASQIISNTRSNDLFATAPVAGTQTATANGLNQLTQVSGAATSHDARGNMTGDGTNTYSYSSQNLLMNAGGVRLNYDALLRLTVVAWGTAASESRRFDYDGPNLIAEYVTGSLTRRYVHGPGVDEPLVQYEGSGTSDRRFLHADERGSIVAHSDGAGAVVQVNRYDEYGAPATGNAGAFQFTGRDWLPELGLYNHRARMRNPFLDRFLQTDPIGYGDGPNLYQAFGGDPVNRVDPSGMAVGCVGRPGSRIRDCSARETAQTFVAQHYDNWSEAGQETLASFVAMYLMNQIGLEFVKSMRDSIRFIESVKSMNIASASLDQGQVARALRTDRDGYHHLNSGIIEGGIVGRIVSADVWGMSSVRIITRFTTTLQCNRCLNLDLFGGSYVARFLNEFGDTTQTYSIRGRIGRAFPTDLAVPAGSDRIELRPTVLTPPDTQVILRGRW